MSHEPEPEVAPLPTAVPPEGATGFLDSKGDTAPTASPLHLRLSTGADGDDGADALLWERGSVRILEVPEPRRNARRLTVSMWKTCFGVLHSLGEKPRLELYANKMQADQARVKPFRVQTLVHGSQLDVQHGDRGAPYVSVTLSLANDLSTPTWLVPPPMQLGIPAPEAAAFVETVTRSLQSLDIFGRSMPSSWSSGQKSPPGQSPKAQLWDESRGKWDAAIQRQTLAVFTANEKRSASKAAWTSVTAMRTAGGLQ